MAANTLASLGTPLDQSPTPRTESQSLTATLTAACSLAECGAALPFGKKNPAYRRPAGCYAGFFLTPPLASGFSVSIRPGRSQSSARYGERSSAPSTPELTIHQTPSPASMWAAVLRASWSSSKDRRAQARLQ